MTIRHHLSDPLLIAYAAGNLPEAFGLVVATHVSLCDECRARLGAYEALGGAVLDEADSADVPLVLVSAPAGSVTTDITGTGVGYDGLLAGDYTNAFGGTSAAAPSPSEDTTPSIT